MNRCASGALILSLTGMRYYLHYRDTSRYFPDQEGMELSDLGAAEVEARRSARELLDDEAEIGDSEYVGGVYEIADDDGSVLAVMRFAESSLH